MAEFEKGKKEIYTGTAEQISGDPATVQGDRQAENKGIDAGTKRDAEKLTADPGLERSDSSAIPAMRASSDADARVPDIGTERDTDKEDRRLAAESQTSWDSVGTSEDRLLLSNENATLMEAEAEERERSEEENEMESK